MTFTRRRLLARLSSLDARGTVVLLLAGAGYGKTTLLQQWAQRAANGVVATVTEVENDVDHFGRLLATAIAGIAPVPAALVDRAHAQSPDWISDIVPALLRVAEQHPVALAVDDTHLLDSPAALELIDALAYRWPSPSTLILSGRRRPPISLMRERVDSPIRTIGEDELDFDGDEIAELAAGDAQHATEIAAMTGGWPAGIRLATLTGQATAAPGDAGPGDGYSSVDDYITTHVLGGLSSAELDFLSHVAVLAPATAAMLDAALNRDDTLSLLRRLRQRGLPMVTLPDDADAPDATITVHSLLGDVLIARLRHRDPEREHSLHDRTIPLAERAGHHQHAFVLARRSGDHERLRRMPYRHMGYLVLNGQTALLANWLSQFPPAEVRRDPHLGIPLIHTMRPRREQRVREWLATFAHDTTTLLPDGTTPALAVQRTLTSVGLAPYDRTDRDLRGGWRQTGLNRLSWELYAADELDEARAILVSLAESASAYPFTDAMRLARLAFIAAEEGDRDAAAAYTAEASARLRDGRLTDLDMTYLVDAAALRLARLDGNLGAAQRLAAVIRSKMANIGEGTRLECITSLIEIAELFLRLERPAGETGELLREARALVQGWGPVPRLERQLDRLDERLAAQPSAPDRADPDVALLSTAELRVLHYLPSHYTIPRIAKELYVSPNTVKSQCASIYRKLRSSGRAEAVQRADQLGLLRPSASASETWTPG